MKVFLSTKMQNLLSFTQKKIFTKKSAFFTATLLIGGAYIYQRSAGDGLPGLVNRFLGSDVLSCWENAKKKSHDLYLWGNGSAEHTSDYTNFHPHKIEKFIDIEGKDISHKFKRIKTVEFGDYFTAVVNEAGELFIWITPFITGDKKEAEDLQDQFEEETTNKAPKQEAENVYELNEMLFPPNNVRKGIIKISNSLEVEDVKFTKNKLFLRTKQGDLYMYSLLIGDIENTGHYIKGPQVPKEINISNELVKIQELKNVKQIATGTDHLIVLNNEGEVYGMGDDSFGQLGLNTFAEERVKQMQTYGNFILRRESKPVKMPITGIIKIACGDKHTLLLSRDHTVYGTGYNRFLQLSNDELYREKYIGLHKPTQLNKLSEKGLKDLSGRNNQKVVDIVCSANCSFFVVAEESKNKENAGSADSLVPTTAANEHTKPKISSYEVYGCGEGLKGALGINYLKHISDLEILPDVSGLINQNNNSPVEIQSFSCGNKHCLLLFKNPRIIFSWGNNEYGELGSKNRVFTESPLPMLEDFMIPNKIVKVFAGKNNSGFICQSYDNQILEQRMMQDNKAIEEQIKKKKELKKLKKETKNIKEVIDEKEKEGYTVEEYKEEEEKKKSLIQKVYSVAKKYL